MVNYDVNLTLDIGKISTGGAEIYVRRDKVSIKIPTYLFTFSFRDIAAIV